MNRCCTVALLVLSQVVVCGCGDNGKNKASGPAEEQKDKSDNREADFEKAIGQNLQTQPSSVKVHVMPNDTIPGNPLDFVHVILEYDAEKSLGYKGLRFEAMHQIGKNPSPRTTIMAIHPEGDKEMKIVTMAFDDDGNKMDSLPFEEDKDKVAAVEKRCKEIDEALLKSLPKEPQTRR